jgi:hypothetical protein
MSLDIPKPKGYRKAWRNGFRHDPDEPEPIIGSETMRRCEECGSGGCYMICSCEKRICWACAAKSPHVDRACESNGQT